MRQAVILVGGKGTRLGALAQDTPKPLLPIDGDIRFLDYVLHGFVRAGVQSVLLLAGHLADAVSQRYDGARFGDARIDVLREPEPAGTGGALLLARDRLDDAFFMANGDSLFDADLAALSGALKPGGLGALALRRVDDAARYGRVTLEDDAITGFHEKDPDWRGPALISGGIYALRRDILKEVPPPPSSIEADVFPRLAAQRRLSGAVFDGYFIDIGLPDTLSQGRRELPLRATPDHPFKP